MEVNGFHRIKNLLRVSKILLEVSQGKELARLGISLKKLHEGQTSKLPPGRGGTVTDQHHQPQGLLPSKEEEAARNLM